MSKITNEDLFQAIKELSGDVKQLDVRVARVETKVDKLDERLGIVENEVKELKQDIRHIDNKMEVFTDDLLEARADIRELKRNNKINL